MLSCAWTSAGSMHTVPSNCAYEEKTHQVKVVQLHPIRVGLCSVHRHLLAVPVGPRLLLNDILHNVSLAAPGSMAAALVVRSSCKEQLNSGKAVL